MKIPRDSTSRTDLGPQGPNKRPGQAQISLEGAIKETTSKPKEEPIREVAKFQNPQFIGFIRTIATRAEEESSESKLSALEEFDKFVSSLYPAQVDYIEETANYMKNLLSSNGISFRDEVQRRYDLLDYRIGNPLDCARKSIYAKMLLLENQKIKPLDLTPGNLEKTTSTLSKLTKSQCRLFISSIFFDTYYSPKDLEKFITALEKITLYAYMGMDEGSSKEKRKISPEVTGIKNVKYFDPLRRRQVNDVMEFPVNDKIAEIIDDIAIDYFKNLEHMAWNRRCNHIEAGISNVDDEPWATSGSIGLKERDYSDPNNYGEELEFERKRQEVLLTGIEAGLFDFTAEGLVELYDLAVDNDIRVRLAENIIREAKHEGKRDYAIDFLCNEIADDDHVQFDDGYLRFNLINLIVNNLATSTNIEDICEHLDFSLDHKDPMAYLATFKAFGHENLFSTGKMHLIEAIKTEVAHEEKGSKLFALLLRQLRLDKEFNSGFGENFETTFRELLLEFPENINIKKTFANLARVKIPYDDNHDISLRRTRKSATDYLEYIGLNRLIVWSTLDKDEKIRTRAQEILELYMDRDLVPNGQKLIENFIRSGDPDRAFLLDGADILNAFKQRD